MGDPVPTRVALLHNIVSPHVVPLFERLAREPDVDLKVYFLADTDRNRRWDTRVSDAFEHEILPHWAIRVGRRDLHTFFVNPTIVKALRRDGFDVVISVGWDSFASIGSFALCKALRKPFILWSGSTIHEPSWRRTLTLPLVRQMVRGSAAWIAYGSRAKDYLVRLGANVDRVWIAYNTVDVDWFKAQADELRLRRADIRAGLGIAAGPTVLYVGQLIERKGVLDLLAAHECLVRKMPDAQLVVVGYGMLEAEMRVRVAQRRIPGVQLAGHVPVSQLPRYYVAADCLALPSHEEVWGLVLNEAAACGLALVTTDAVGAGADLVESGVNGRVIPPGNPSRLCDALLDALENAAIMGKASQSIVERATFQQNVGAIVAAIRACVPQLN